MVAAMLLGASLCVGVGFRQKLQEGSGKKGSFDVLGAHTQLPLPRGKDIHQEYQGMRSLHMSTARS